MEISRKDSKTTLELDDTEFQDLVFLVGAGNLAYMYDRDVEEKQRDILQKMTDQLENFR